MDFLGAKSTLDLGMADEPAIELPVWRAAQKLIREGWYKYVDRKALKQEGTKKGRPVPVAVLSASALRAVAALGPAQERKKKAASFARKWARVKKKAAAARKEGKAISGASLDQVTADYFA